MTDPDAQPKPFKWSKARIDAAELLAEDVLTDAQIATRLGITDRTLRTWKHVPEFRAKVDQHIVELQEWARKAGIARLSRRLERYARRAEALDLIVAERAADPDMQDVPGGRSGYLVRTIKQIGGGEMAREVEEYAPDPVLLRELRELEKQVAVEVGDWNRKLEVAGPDGGPITIVFAEREGPD